MADKFPDIGANEQPLGDDLLAREKELLGEDAQQFQTGEEEQEVEEEEEDEVAQFEQQFPHVEASSSSISAEEPEAVREEDEVPDAVYSAPAASQAVAEWKERFQLEVSQRDEADAAKTAKTRQEAEAQLDDFYEAYNVKKEEQIAKAAEAQEQFLEKRDSFFSEGSVWRRALQLVQGAPENKRFKEVLEAKVRTIQD
jgi:selenocysteine-specific translation elongation factor